MADSSLETQIDCFLEQFKRSASKAMEERQNVCRSRSSYLENDSPGMPGSCLTMTVRCVHVHVHVDWPIVIRAPRAFLSGLKYSDRYVQDSSMHLSNNWSLLMGLHYYTHSTIKSIINLGSSVEVFWSNLLFYHDTPTVLLLLNIVLRIRW